MTGYRLARHIAGLATAPSSSCSSSPCRRASASTASTCSVTRGRDSGAGGDVFIAIDALALVWTLALVLIGIRVTQRWTWGRAAAALGIAALFAILLGTLTFAAAQ